MFSEQLRKEAELRFQRQLPYFGQRKAEILCQMGQCSEEEQILMKFLYGTMPLRDVGVYDFSVRKSESYQCQYSPPLSKPDEDHGISQRPGEGS